MDVSGSASRAAEEMAASPYRILTGGEGLCSFLVANGWMNRLSTAAAMMTLRASEGILDLLSLYALALGKQAAGAGITRG